MSCVIFGAGKIARGFIAHLLSLSDIDFVFVEKADALADLINEREQYTINILGAPEKNYVVKNAKALKFSQEKEITEVNAVAIIILSLIIRLVSMKYLDGTVIYDCLLVYLTHTALAIGLFSLSRKIFDLKSRSSIDWFDDISYFVYITHYMFMVGPLRTMGLTSNLLLNTIITVTLSFFSATLLQRIYRTVIMENIK